jgi:hypothetical protein
LIIKLINESIYWHETGRIHNCGNGLLHEVLGWAPAIILTILLFKVNEVEKVVKNLKGKCSSGFDDVTDSIVKKYVQFIKKPLADICNGSFASGIFPDRLKIAVVKPLHKKGNTGEVQNYRPISLLSVFFKDCRKVNV